MFLMIYKLAGFIAQFMRHVIDKQTRVELTIIGYQTDAQNRVANYLNSK